MGLARCLQRMHTDWAVNVLRGAVPGGWPCGGPVGKRVPNLRIWAAECEGGPRLQGPSEVIRVTQRHVGPITRPLTLPFTRQLKGPRAATSDLDQRVCKARACKTSGHSQAWPNKATNENVFMGVQKQKSPGSCDQGL